jgi:hypothetical protein
MEGAAICTKDFFGGWKIKLKVTIFRIFFGGVSSQYVPKRFSKTFPTASQFHPNIF